MTVEKEELMTESETIAEIKTGVAARIQKSSTGEDHLTVGTKIDREIGEAECMMKDAVKTDLGHQSKGSLQQKKNLSRLHHLSS